MVSVYMCHILPTLGFKHSDGECMWIICTDILVSVDNPLKHSDGECIHVDNLYRHIGFSG